MNASRNRSDALSPGFSRLCIFGAGGFGREVAWLARQTWGKNVDLLFAVDDARFLCDEVNRIPVELLANLKPDEDFRFLVAIGAPDARRIAARSCREAGMRAARLVHPRAETSEHVELGLGTIICAGNILTTNISVGEHVHINLACTIGHDVRIGDFTTISPGCHISGHVHIGSNVFIGTGANIINGVSDAPLTIGDGAIVAAGACVTRSVEPDSMVAGVPAVPKHLRRHG
ncbi:acetyltransferase [Oleiagrimonas citrea]|uniref:Acetyltransferase n=1 Tax=Oleiagrimonas citrea TaxID=1665687 RepID=A0A846ZP44_9GAMM|nr:acetyltransferase [Oleiagrimonas citrea]NKZ39662.1 acetyltransferase [Oleiagrimonas citrea]